MQDNNKNKFLDSLRPLHGESGRAHPKKTIMRSPGGPTQKKTKIFLVVVAHFLHVQIQPILLTDKIRKFFMLSGGTSH